MGYTNPQRIIDQSFDTFTNASKRWVGQIAKTNSEIYDRNIKEKEQQNLQWEKDNEAQQVMYSRVNELGSTGNSALDENIRGFWDSRVQQYFEIKNAMSRGDMEQQEGNKLLAGINGQLSKFTKVIPYMASQISLQVEHGKIKPGTAGAIASTTAGQSQNVIGSVATGGDTAIVMKNNLMYFYNPPIEGEQDGAFMNVDEMLAKQAAGKDIIELVPDISKELSAAYKNVYTPDEIGGKYVTTKTDQIGGYNYERKTYATEVMNETTGDMEPFDAKTAGIQQMIDDGQFDGIVEDGNIMESVWQDMIPDDYIEQYAKDNGMDINVNSAWHQVDPQNPDDVEAKELAWLNQDTLAKQWLSEQAYDNNSELDNTMKYISRTKIPKPAKSSTSNPSTSTSTNYGSYSDPLEGATYVDAMTNAPSGTIIYYRDPEDNKVYTKTKK